MSKQKRPDLADPHPLVPSLSRLQVWAAAAQVEIAYCQEAASIKRHIAEGERSFAKAAEELIAVKERLPHGSWLPWLKENGIEKRTAQRIIDEHGHPEKTEARLAADRERRKSNTTALSHLEPSDDPDASPKVFQRPEYNIDDGDDDEPPDPRNAVTAFMLGVEHAIRLSRFTGKPTKEMAVGARAAAAAWTEAAQKIEESL